MRELLAVEFGELATASRGRFSGWFYLTPDELELPYQDVAIDTLVGPRPRGRSPRPSRPTAG